MKFKILIILGPTASGKSDLAVKLAQQWNGEVISADSRQVYKGLDIGTGKITKEEMQGIPHYCLDIADPRDRFTVVDWKEKARQAILDIHNRGKLPIICGGTGFYISALVDNLEIPDVSPNEDLRRELGEKSVEELFDILKRLDPVYAKKMISGSRNGDDKNKRRLIRAIEIATSVQEKMEGQRVCASQPVDESTSRMLPHEPSLHDHYDPIFIGVNISSEELRKRIHKRLVDRIDIGMIDEAKNLHKNGLSYERMNELGLEYRYLAEFLQGKIDKDQLIEILSTKIWQYARRQKTWWRKDERIKWFDPKNLIEKCAIDKQLLM
ncbi:MAG: tRNA (adenosine(37)-N6)-dimethylallyltransferase MiaA [Candidatus Paceibacterota bacterium]|jgi:tRNA dimethylallyltransferase